MERLPEPLHASVRRVLHQAWELDDADKAEKLIRNLAQRLERDAPAVSTSILEGLDEILAVTRLGLPAELRRSLACTKHHRERHGHGAQGLPQRETLAIDLDGAALDSCGHERSIEGLPQAEGSQAIANLAFCAHRLSRENIKQRRSCERSEGRVT
jgi:hypothetical protein